MKISIVGLGYVGLVTLAVMAELGHDVVGLDIDKNKILGLKSGKIPIYEPGLSKMLEKNKERISYSDSYECIKGSKYSFICVPTPTVNERIDVHFVIDAGKEINNVDSKTNIVIKSTVIPGTARKLSEEIDRGIISNPEFLREGNALKDTMAPDRVVVGGNKVEEFAKIWEFTKSPILITSNENAELIKYASNSFLATKISFINQIADLCEKIPNADVKVIERGMGLDKRIGMEFLKAGTGFGGSCFPKDTKALVSFSEDLGISLSIVKSTIDYNEKRIPIIVNKLKKIITQKNSKILILGLSFKDNTDDIRESKSLELIRNLELEGYRDIWAYDPVVTKVEGIRLISDLDSAIEDSEYIIVATEWPLFSEKLQFVNDRHIIDLRRVLEPVKTKLDYGVGLYFKD
ncbi:UDP-glucose dehydrogenase family protein [Cuniculiplasma sp. SKW4]|uniref:UDP-glucose dehydrogenase family protein n=1 Tax=Cuniculiplasma sp. SKW4 TaxID=3400171 RepID=UPI003FD44497